MTLRELLAQKAAAAARVESAAAPEEETPGLPAAPAPVRAFPPHPAPDRQLGTREAGQKDGVVPMTWPDDPACCEGNQLAVMIDEEGRGWLGVMQPSGRFIYLLGPLGALGIPF